MNVDKHSQSQKSTQFLCTTKSVVTKSEAKLNLFENETKTEPKIRPLWTKLKQNEKAYCKFVSYNQVGLLAESSLLHANRFRNKHFSRQIAFIYAYSEFSGLKNIALLYIPPIQLTTLLCFTIPWKFAQMKSITINSYLIHETITTRCTLR
jgi:hypothetical protein